MNSASPLLNETLDCVEDQVLIVWRPKSTQPPLVLLRVRGQPAQPVSVYTSRDSTDCRAYLYTNRGGTNRYRHNRRRACQELWVGGDIHLLVSLAAS